MFKNQYKKYMIFEAYFAFKQQMKQTQKLSYFIKILKFVTINEYRVFFMCFFSYETSLNCLSKNAKVV
jgi:hypothetical protein